MARNYKSITEIPGWMNRLTDDGVPDSSAVLYKRVPYLFRAIQLRCDTLSSVPLKLYNGEKEVEWPYPTPLSDLLWKWEASLLLKGACYGEIVTNDSQYQKDVIYYNPFNMNVKYEDGALVIKQISTGVTWTNDYRNGQYEMVYLAEFDPTQDLLPGVSSSDAANIDIKLLFALAKFPEMFFEGGAMPVTLLGIDSTDKGEITRIEHWFKKSATTIRNAFRVLGVRAGSISPTTLTPPIKDLVLPELNDVAKHNICVAFGIPKTLLDSEAANFATAQEDRKSFYEDTVMPRARKFESELGTQLLERDGLRLEFAFTDLELFQDDETQRVEILRNLRLAGIPINLALDMAGYELTEEQTAALLRAEEEKQARADEDRDDDPEDQLENRLRDELTRWMRMAEKRIKDGRELREFESDIIPAGLHGAISGALETVKTADDIQRLFDGVIAWEGYP